MRRAVHLFARISDLGKKDRGINRYVITGGAPFFIWVIALVLESGMPTRLSRITNVSVPLQEIVHSPRRSVRW